MKLKYVVLSMSLLGLISSSASASHYPKHKIHHRMTQEQTTPVVDNTDYKGELPALLDNCPRTDMYTLMLTRITQNVGRAVPTVGCDKPIAFAGGLNFDTKWGNRSPFMGKNKQRFSVNDAYLNVYGNVNEWASAFLSASYGSPRGANPARYATAYKINTLDLEQGFITIKNWHYLPIYLQVGKQFQPFGRYTIHPMTRTMDQVLTESLQTSAQVGFIVPMGFHGAAYVFDNPMKQVSAAGLTKNMTPLNFGVELGYDHMSDQLGYDIGFGYLNNMTGVNDVAYSVGVFNGSSTVGTGTYINTVGAGSMYADLNSGPFSIGFRFASALQRFNIADLGNNMPAVVTTRGAQPWAAGLTAGYAFNAWSKNQNLYLGYQASGDAVNVFLPQGRWLAGYGIEAWKNTNVGLEYTHDKAYSTSKGGSGSSSNNVNLRLGVMFG